MNDVNKKSGILENISIIPCIYTVNFSFSCFDVLTAEELNDVKIYVNDEEVDELKYTCTKDDEGRFIYNVQTQAPKKFILKIQKLTYYPFSKEIKFTSNNEVIGSERLPERIPMLSEIRTSAVTLTWGKLPNDLDAKLINPDGSITNYIEENRQTYYSYLDIDDKFSYGPETISFNKWTNWNSKYKVTGTFNYRVNWFSNENTNGNGIGAVVTLFLNPENPITFNARPELKGEDRVGQDWNVFNINYESILGIHHVNPENLITCEFNIPNFSNIPSGNTGEIRVLKDSILSGLFINYNFVYAVYNNENELPSSGYTIEKENENYNFTGSASDSSNIIKFYLNEKFKEENLPYITFNGTSSISYKKLLKKDRNNFILIPFILYNEKGEKIEEVNYRYEVYSSNYSDYDYIYIDIRNRQNSFSNVSKISYILGVDDIHNYSEFKDEEGNVPKNLSTYDSFLYYSNEEIENIKFNYDDLNKKLNIIGNIFYKDNNFNYTFENIDQFDIHILPYTNNVQFHYLSNLFLNESNESLLETEQIISFVNSVVTTNFKTKILKEDFKDGNENIQKVDINLILKRITALDEENNEIKEIEFESFNWDNDGLNVIIKEEINNQKCKFEFEKISLKIKREKFNLNKISSERPSIYFGTCDENNNFIEETKKSYLYTWDADYLNIFFLTEPNLNESNEVIKLIHYFKIYHFDVEELNYFEKSLTINVNLYNYDDQIFNMDPVQPRMEYDYSNYEYISISGQKNPIYWENLNLYKYNEKKSKYILDQSKCESSYYGYQKNIFETNESIQNNYWVNLTHDFSNIQENANYKISITTKFLKNDYYEIISLYNDLTNVSQQKIELDTESSQIITYDILYPYVNFFGNFYDLNENRYSDEYIKNTITKKASGSNNFESKYFQILSYKILLTNTNPNLSADLLYEYKSPEIDSKYAYFYKKFTGSYSYGSPVYEESEGPYYQFMFKQSAFYNINEYYNDYGYPYNQYLESIYTGNYNMSVSLCKLEFGKKINNNSFKPKYNEETPEIYNFGNINLTKENEATSALYNYKVEIPFVTISGKIINKADNSLVYGQDLTVEFINKNDAEKSRKFVYDCYIPYSNNGDYGDLFYQNWSKEKQNRLDQTFLFKLFGLGRNFPPYYIDENNNIVHYELNYINNDPLYWPTDINLKHHEPGIPEGTYDIKVYYKDIIFKEINDIEINRETILNNNLSSLIIESPLIDLSGKLEDKDGNILSGEKWTVSIYDTNDNLIRNYRYAYSVNEKYFNGGYKDGYYHKEKYGLLLNSFSFKNLPLSTAFDLKHENFDISNTSLSSEWSIERQNRYALQPGQYNIKVKYKNKIVKEFPMTLTKEEETLGDYQDIRLNVGQIFKDITFRFKDDQSNEYLNLGYLRYDLVQNMKLYDENYDGNVEDDQFNETYYTPSIYPPYYYGEANDENDKVTFLNLFMGYYKLDFIYNYHEKPMVNSIENSISGYNILQHTSNPTTSGFDLIDIASENVNSGDIFDIHLNHWYGQLGLLLYSKNIENKLLNGINQSNLITIFTHKNLISGDNYISYNYTGYNCERNYNTFKTGLYNVISYIKDPDDNLIEITDLNEIKIKPYNNEINGILSGRNDYVKVKNRYNNKKIRFIFFSEIEDDENSIIYKINYNKFQSINFSNSLTGNVKRFLYDSEMISDQYYENDNFINGLNFYYSFGKILTKNYSDSTNFYGEDEKQKYVSNLIHLYKLNNNYNFDAEFDKLSSLISIKYSDLSLSGYTDNLLTSGKFQIDNLRDDDIYVAILDKYFINVNLKVFDKNENIILNYNYSIYIYDIDNNLVATTERDDEFYYDDENDNILTISSKYGYNNNKITDLSWNVIPLKAGKYKIKIYYQGMDITPQSLNNYQNWYHKDENLNIYLDFSLYTVSGTLVYPGNNNELLNSDCYLGINVTKLISYDESNNNFTLNDQFINNSIRSIDVDGSENEILYYIKKYSDYYYDENDDFTKTWTSNNEFQIPDLMPGLYKIKIFYHDFGEKNRHIDGDSVTHGGRFVKTFTNNELSSNFTLPITELVTDQFGELLENGRKLQGFKKIENLDLVFSYEYESGNISEINGNKIYFNIEKFSPNLYSASLNGENIIISKNNNEKTLSTYIEEKFSNLGTITYNNKNRKTSICFGDLLKTVYLLVNEHGACIINENELSNYASLKNKSSEMSTSTIGQIELPYIYLDKYSISVSGYPNKWHETYRTKLKISRKK